MSERMPKYKINVAMLNSRFVFYKVRDSQKIRFILLKEGILAVFAAI